MGLRSTPTSSRAKRLVLPGAALPLLAPMQQPFALPTRHTACLSTTSTPKPGNQPLPKSARNNGSNCPHFPLFHVGNDHRLAFLQLTPLLVHGYDITSGLSKCRPREGRPCGRPPHEP